MPPKKRFVIKPGSKAPEFVATAFDQQRDLIQLELANFQGQYVLLVFFPNGNPVCPTEWQAFSELLPKFHDRGCVVLACTVAKPESISRLKEQPVEQGGIMGVKFPILCDEDGTICSSYGVLDERGHSRRASIILDRSHQIQHVAIYDLKVGRSAKETLELLSAYQDADKLALGMPVAFPDNSNGSAVTIRQTPTSSMNRTPLTSEAEKC